MRAPSNAACTDSHAAMRALYSPAGAF